MKTGRIMKCLAVVICLWLSAAPVMAQKNIDKLVGEIENRDDASVNSVTKRDPKTRKIVRVIKSLSLKDERMAKRLIEAFEKDEEYAETAIKDMPKGRKDASRVNFTLTYRSDGEKRTYTLNTGAEGNINLSVIIRQENERGRDTSDYSIGFDWDSFQMDAGQVEEMKRSIRKSLEGLKLKNLAEVEIIN